MFPAWLSRRKDTQKLKQKQPEGLFFLPSPEEFQDTAEPPTASFAYALSLHKSISRARDSLLEAELAGFRAARNESDSRRRASRNQMRYGTNALRPSHIYQSQREGEFSTYDTRTGARVRDAVLFGADSMDASSMLCSRSGVEAPASLASDGAALDEKLHFMFSTNHAHELPLPKDSRRPVLCLQNGRKDNDNEGSTILTPDSTDSSFGSESSSISSLLVRKCGFMEDSRQCLLQLAKEAFPFGSENLECVHAKASLTRLLLLDDVHSLGEWMQEKHMPEIFECVNDSFLKGNLESPDSNYGKAVDSKKHNASRSSGMADSRSLLNSDLERMHEVCFPNSLNSAGSMSVEKSLGFASSLHSPAGESEVSKNYPIFNGGHRSPSAASDMLLECIGSVAGYSNSEGTLFGRILSNKWEESSALIAAENPSLMLSSKWQEDAQVGPCCPQDAPSNERESNARINGDFNLPLCERLHSNNISSRNKLCNDSTCHELRDSELQEYKGSKFHDEGIEEHHRSKHDAYIRNGRRHRGSSFSAALPENLQGVAGDSVALVQMSHSPYEDFRHSMYEMIMEQDLEEGPMVVEELLDCYLTLNSPELHPMIEEVFSDVWSSILMNVR